MDFIVAVISTCIQDLPGAVFSFMYLQFLLENSTPKASHLMRVELYWPAESSLQHHNLFI
jgi:hypothetical protein